MDYDDDGILDFISGSYDPGDLYLFRGEGNGNYAKVERIMDKSGLPVVHHPEEFAKYEKMKADPAADEQESIHALIASFGSWPAPVDWEGDGDLDLLVGSFAGDLFLRINEGSRKEPVYDTKSIPVEADGKPLHVNMHAAPVVADWNQDGLWDLIVGSGDGAVGWFANIGSRTAPAFGPYQLLVSPASDTKFFEQNLTPGAVPAHGVRAQICVTDYDHDGRLDLILGDYSDVNWMRDLTEAEQKDFDALLQIQSKMIARYQSVSKAYFADQKNEELKKKVEELQKEFGKLDRKKKAYSTRSARASFIWLFLRKDTGFIEAAPAARTESLPAQSKRTAPSRVTMSAKLAPVEQSKDRLKLSVKLDIDDGWFVYGDLSPDSTMNATSIQLELPQGIEAVGEWEQPIALPSPKNPRNKIYMGAVTFTRELKLKQPASGQSIRVKVEYQACTEAYCLPPAVLQESVQVRQ